MPVKKTSKKETEVIIQTLQNDFPIVTTFLTHDTSFQLLIAVILSAQCTDARVNKVTPSLFEAYPDARSMAAASIGSLTELIKSIHFANAKARNILKTCHILCEKYNEKVPSTLEELVKLPGVGRKTANVVLGQAFGVPGITVDTHVQRVSKRIGWTTESDPVKIEKDLMREWPESTWIDMSSRIILHGRTVCFARKPNCLSCSIRVFCQCGKTSV